MPLDPIAMVVHNRWVHRPHQSCAAPLQADLRRKEGSAVSQRTRTNRTSKPGVAAVNKPARFDRQVEHRRVRRAAHVELATLAEPEECTLPLPVHISMKADPAERPELMVGRRRFRVWKTKSWKRRTSVRAQRAAAYRSLA
jgi:hypothetical protein